MNTVILTDKRDFPLSTNALKFIQEAYSQLEQLTKVVGDNYILSGCTVTGSSASSGWVVIGGKLMPFVSNTIQTTVRVVSDTQIKTVGSGTREETTVWAEFGTSANPAENIPWATLDANRIANKRLITTAEATKLTELYTKLQLDTKFATTRVDLTVLSAQGYTLPDASYYCYLLVNNKTISLFGRVRSGTALSPNIASIPASYRAPNAVLMPVLNVATSALVYGSAAGSQAQVGQLFNNVDLSFSATWLIE